MMGWRSFALVAALATIIGGRGSAEEPPLPPRALLDRVRLEDPALVSRFLQAAIDPAHVQRLFGIALGVPRTF